MPTPHANTAQIGDRAARVYDPGLTQALVIVLHGLGGTGDGFARTTGFDDQAAKHDWLAVYPDGKDKEWNAGFCCPFAAPPQVDDVAFMVALIDRFAKPGWKVFVTGFSNGGMMAYRLACDLPQQITAIGVVGADSEECSPRPPLPAILHMQGTADKLTGNRVWGLRSGQWVNTEPSATARWQQLGAKVTLVSVPGGDHRWYPDASQKVGDFFASS